MASKKKTKKKGNVRELDFSDVESGGLVPEGSHLAEITEVEIKTSDKSGEEYVAFKAKTNKGNLFFNCSLQPQALFNLRGLLEACGYEIPDGPEDIDFDELIGCEFIAEVDHEKYKKKLRSRVNGYLPVDEDAEVEEDEEEDEDEEDGDEEDAEDEDEEDAEDEEDGDEEDEEGEEDEVVVEDGEELEPISEEELADMSVKELQEVVDNYELDVDLKKFRSARKKVGAVQDALEAEGYLAE